MVEEALLSGEAPKLADAEIGRLLGVSGWVVGKYRRRLEVRGEITPVDIRIGRRGYIDVRRLGRPRIGPLDRGASEGSNADRRTT
jgi:hypothetical protein